MLASGRTLSESNRVCWPRNQVALEKSQRGGRGGVRGGWGEGVCGVRGFPFSTTGTGPSLGPRHGPPSPAWCLSEPTPPPVPPVAPPWRGTPWQQLPHNFHLAFNPVNLLQGHSLLQALESTSKPSPSAFSKHGLTRELMIHVKVIIKVLYVSFHKPKCP